MKTLSIAVLLFLLSACSSYGTIDNRPLSGTSPDQSYGIRAGADGGGSEQLNLILTFSGGGTRAAALAYGVLQELRDTQVTIDGRSRRLLDEIDTISSVSGGSFTSAYFGLYGDRIFDDFESAFLRRDVQGLLLRGLLNPLRLLSNRGRTDMVVDFYEQELFHGATFTDLQQAGGPLILINASDLGYGVRFTFTQEFFNLLCSDISDFPIARAVTASSAVPALFEPVVLKNYRDCKQTKPAWLVDAEQRAEQDPQLADVVEGLSSYFDMEEREYAHMVDGGITDNLGLRAIYEITEVAGGPWVFMEEFEREPPRRLVVISVNASTALEPKMDRSNRQPSLSETISAVTKVQLHRYNAATLDLMDQALERWASELSTPRQTVTPYFIQLGFRDIKDPKQVRFFNHVPTNFTLTEEQVDRLIATGRKLLRNNPDFQRFLASLGDEAG